MADDGRRLKKPKNGIFSDAVRLESLYPCVVCTAWQAGAA
jgi:hypothetical protein